MNHLQYIVLHCLDTPKGRWVSKNDILQWHLSPCDVYDRKNDDLLYVLYRGKRYPSRRFLPDEMINGISIQKLHGRGWRVPGYAELFHNNGEVENITPYNEDDFVDPWEITNGAKGINSISRHYALEGGWLDGERNLIAEFHDLYSDEMFVSLSGYLKQQVKDHPHIRIIGHNEVPYSGKTCPNFEVPKFCRSIGISEINIGYKS